MYMDGTYTQKVSREPSARSAMTNRTSLHFTTDRTGKNN